MHMIVYREPEASCHWYCLWYEYQLHLWELSNLIFFSTISLVGRFGVESVPWFFGYIHITTTISAKKKKICTHKCPLRNRGVFVDLEWCVQLLRTRCTGHIIPFYPWFLQQDRRCHDRPCDIWGKDMKPLHESSSLEDQTYKHVLKIKKRNCFLSFRWWRQCYLIYSYQWL